MTTEHAVGHGSPGTGPYVPLELSAQIEADYYRKQAAKYYRRGRQYRRRAVRYDEVAVASDEMAAFWLTHTDDSEHEFHASEWTKSARIWRELAESARNQVTAQQETARFYRGLQRRYEKMAARNRQLIEEHTDARTHRNGD